MTRIKVIIGAISIIIGLFLVSPTITGNVILANSEKLTNSFIGLFLIIGGFFLEYSYLKRR